MASRARLFSIDIDQLDMSGAVGQVLQWLTSDQRTCRVIVTPNVDHLVLLEDHDDLQAAYRRADLVLADGFPLVLASRWLGRHKRLPERVPGSELVPQLLAAWRHAQPLRLFLLGAAPGVAQRAAQQIEGIYTHVHISGVCSPPLGFEGSEVESHKIVQQLHAAQPDLIVVGLGAPKQELWVDRHRDKLPASVVICAGATIDFLAGEKRRAPRWMQRYNLEWLHRLLSEPRRLASRYARDAWIFPRLVWRELRSV